MMKNKTNPELICYNCIRRKIDIIESGMSGCDIFPKRNLTDHYYDKTKPKDCPLTWKTRWSL